MVLQGLVRPRPAGTLRLIAAGLAALPPLCPGSSTTTGASAAGVLVTGGAADDGETTGGGATGGVTGVTELTGAAGGVSAEQPATSTITVTASARRITPTPCHTGGPG
ncbi:hypothetical protein GCM10027199_11950 [Amycolatopsis magusensis]